MDLSILFQINLHVKAINKLVLLDMMVKIHDKYIRSYACFLDKWYLQIENKQFYT